jgi:hypothetical protein
MHKKTPLESLGGVFLLKWRVYSLGCGIPSVLNYMNLRQKSAVKLSASVDFSSILSKIDELPMTLVRFESLF